MGTGRAFFQVERLNDVLIVEPHWLACDGNSDRCDRESDRICATLKSSGITTIIVDFRHIQHCRKCLLIHLLKWWAEVGRHRDRMRLCNITQTDREILRCLQFDRLWEIYATRSEALHRIQRASASPSVNPIRRRFSQSDSTAAPGRGCRSTRQDGVIHHAVQRR